MRAKFRLLSAAAIGLLTATTTFAETVFECEATYRSRDGWTPDRIFFIFDDDMQSVKVLDGIINAMHEKPIPAEIKKRSGQRYDLSWTVRDIRASDGGEVTVQYSAMVNSEKGRFSVNGYVGGYDNNARSEGNCKRAPGSS
ncbi:MAG: hypothetical protein AAGF27_07430 [Pseudomonadota bacterium]